MIKLSPSQQEACDKFRIFLRDPKKTEFLLSGFAGSGKSFLIKYLLQLVEDEYKLIRLIAPNTPKTCFHFTATTNKAANVLANMLQKPTRTTHQALGLVVQVNFNKGTTFLTKKKDDAGIDLTHSVLIIDEASMINHQLLAIIRKLTKKAKNCKVLYIGDSYQLSPIKEDICPIFQDAKESAFLTDIQRQALNSPIITLSHEYRKMLDDPQKPWPKIIKKCNEIIQYNDPQLWKEAIKNVYLVPHKVNDVRILAWSNDRVRGYNNWIRRQLGYTSKYETGETLLCNTAIIIGDRVRASTDSTLKVESSTPSVQEGIPGHDLVLNKNGNYLSIFQPDDWKKANQIATNLAVRAKKATGDDRIAYWERFWIIKKEWGDFRPIYAQTVHKSQGSTYSEVFIDLFDIAKNTKWREIARLMYVAVTRASHKVHLFGSIDNTSP